MGISLLNGALFILHHSSLLFGNDEVVSDVSAVVGKIRELLENARNIIPQ